MSFASCTRPLALALLLVPVAASAQVELRLEKRPEIAAGTLRLSWTGGVSDYEVYESADPRRVYSPARRRVATDQMQWDRSASPAEAALLFFKIGCPGGGCDELCFDGVDNDSDGDLDCADADCLGVVDCIPETDCSDGIDNEGDDLIDCEDPDCPAACDDGDACTLDSCDESAPGACLNLAVVCDDGNACNGLETCDPSDGSCLPGTPLVCDDGDPCNGLETCDPVDGSCLPGTPVACDDGDPCNGLETCDPADGSCLPGTPPDCSDGDACTADVCDSGDGSCSNPPVDCDDGNACNGLETCDPSDGSCLPGTPVVCDDGDPCNGLETCDPVDGTCIPGIAPDCSDGDSCTEDLCDPSDGSCSNPPVACDDADACNGLETCDPADGSCLPGTPVDCDDAIACTIDDCDPLDGSCSNVARDCDDGEPCNGVETCDSRTGDCVPGLPPDCDDMNPCTTDSCDALLGCLNDPIVCDDSNPCTMDSCDPILGCRFVPDPMAVPGRPAQLAGIALGQFPWFEFALTHSVNTAVELGVDPSALPGVDGQTCDVYVVETRSAEEWCADNSLVDVRGAPDSRSFSAGSTQGNIFPLVAANQLPADNGRDIGRGYDVVLDCDRDGQLGASDWIDGGGERPGFFLAHDISALGPGATNSFDEIGPLGPPTEFAEGDDMRIFYPGVLDDPSFVGRFPVVVVSHGNGHNFQWYDFLQAHLASYGFVVMSHENNTEPGIETASTSTLHFTDRLLDEQASLGSGVLDGHLDESSLIWIGHSRGGEGVARAYRRLRDGEMRSRYDASDIRLVQSIAPTDFLGSPQSDSLDVPYGLLYGAADGDVNGCPGNPVGYGFNVYARSVGPKASCYLHGAGHNDFNACGQGAADAMGPNLIGCVEAQQVQKAWTLALIQHMVEGNLAAKDFLWRQQESLRPVGVQPTTIAGRDYLEQVGTRPFVIDDYQSQPDVNTSSSGAAVSFDVSNPLEDLLEDTTAGLGWVGSDPMNGLTRTNAGAANPDQHAGFVFDYDADRFLQFSIAAPGSDFSDDDFLSFRAGQMPRHPQTTAALEELDFTVTLEDGSGNGSSIRITAYGAGLEEPYQRTSFFIFCTGAGAGWQTEFETIRIRLSDFLRDGQSLDLADVAFLRFDFGASFGSAAGRIIIDDLAVVRE